jgi:8-oxo-dGTP diphosphatase
MKKGVEHIAIGVCYFCHDGAGRVLLSKRGARCRDEHGRWDAGGGGIEFGHSAEETLRKEIREEYGADVLEYEFMGFRDLFRDQGGVPTHWVMLDFKVRIDPAQAKNGEPDKFDEVAWFPLDRLPTPMHSAWQAFFDKNEKYLKF